MTLLKQIGIFSLLALGVATTLATENEDVASNYASGWTNGSNEGGGFNAWEIKATAGNGSAEYGIWDSEQAELSMGEAFGLSAAGEGASVYATRSFETAMAAGDVFRFDLGLNASMGEGGDQGFTLCTESGSVLVSVSHAGDSDTITLNGEDMFASYGISTMHWTFTQVSSTEIMLYATGRSSSDTYTTVLTFENSSWIASVCFYTLAATDDEYLVYRGLYFNNLSLSQGSAATGLFTYTVDSSRAIISRVSTSATGNIVVPAKLGNYAVGTVSRAAFKDCTGITGISFADGSTVTNVGPMAFAGCTALTVATLPSGLSTLSAGLFHGCEKLGAIVIPSTVTTIEDAVFAQCRSLSGVTLPSGLTSIGESVFLNCRNLTTLNLPSLETVPGQLCYECRGLAGIDLPGTVTDIGYKAFHNCLGFTELSWDAALVSLEDGALSGCSGLKSILFNAGVASLGSEVFADCSSLTQIYIAGAAPTVSEDTFSDCTATLYYDEGASGWSDSLGGLATAVWGSEPDPVLPTLAYSLENGQLVLSFTGILQSSSDLVNWTQCDSADVLSTHALKVGSEENLFFRAMEK